jgi:hypothetical protein
MVSLAMEMADRRTRRSVRGRVHAVLLVALLPVFALGPALGGGMAWFHSHGPSGGHLHLVPSEHGHDHDALDAWHEVQHHRAQEGESHEVAEHAPDGLRIEMPAVIATAPSKAPAPGTSIAPPAFLPSPGWSVELPGATCRPERCRSGWPPGKARRSGVAALLRSSHAILI